jgi:hypothetical protein
MASSAAGAVLSGGAGHAVIISGVDTADPTVSIDDPPELRAPVSKEMYAYMGTLTQSPWENPLFVYA